MNFKTVLCSQRKIKHVLEQELETPAAEIHGDALGRQQQAFSKHEKVSLHPHIIFTILGTGIQ